MTTNFLHTVKRDITIILKFLKLNNRVSIEIFTGGFVTSKNSYVLI